MGLAAAWSWGGPGTESKLDVESFTGRAGCHVQPRPEARPRHWTQGSVKASQTRGGPERPLQDSQEQVAGASEKALIPKQESALP